MDTPFPQRPTSHQLEDKSKLYFRQCLPAGWTADEPQKDYGVDVRVQIAEETFLTGKALVVQLKATAEVEPGDSVALTLGVSTLNYLRSLLEVAMVVKYVEPENEAYWLLLKDVPQPAEGQKTITVRIPKANRLSANPWPEIQGYVTQVHYKKLGAMHQTNGPAT
jgi:Domain of unknown function (DUF4365)